MRKVIEYGEYTQRNNVVNPLGSCFPTSVAMALSRNFYSKELEIIFTQDDVINVLCNGPLGKQLLDSDKFTANERSWMMPLYHKKVANTIWKVEQEVVRYIIGEDYCKYYEDKTLDDIKAEIDRGYGVAIGFNINPTDPNIGGHIALMVGYDTTRKTLIFNDPYGDFMTGYRNQRGYQVEYPEATIMQRKHGSGNYIRCMFIHPDLAIPCV